MTVDYRVTSYKSLSPVSKIGLYSSSPKTLDIRGQNFRDIVTVYINSVPSPEFIVLSSSRILAQVPNSQLKAAIRSVRVFTADGDKLAETSVINLESVHNGSPAEGRVRLVQSFLKRLLTTPGSDIFQPESGAGVLQMVGSIGRPELLKAAAATAVNSAQDQEIQAQSRSAQLLPSERLKSVTLLSAEFVPFSSTLSLRIRLTSVDGLSADAAFSV